MRFHVIYMFEVNSGQAHGMCYSYKKCLSTLLRDSFFIVKKVWWNGFILINFCDYHIKVLWCSLFFFRKGSLWWFYSSELWASPLWFSVISRHNDDMYTNKLVADPFRHVRCSQNRQNSPPTINILYTRLYVYTDIKDVLIKWNILSISK